MLKVDPDFVWYASSLVGIGLVIFLRQLPSGSLDAKANSPSDTISESKLELTLPLILILSASLFFGVEAGIRNLIYQPFILSLTENNLIHLAYFQALLATVRLGGLLVYRYKLKKINKAPLMALFAGLAFAAGEVVAALEVSYPIFLMAYATGVFCLSWYFPIRLNLLNQQIKEKWRARVLSLDSTIEMLTQGIVCVLIGLSSAENIFNTLWIIAAGSMTICTTMIYISSHKSSKG